MQTLFTSDRMIVKWEYWKNMVQYLEKWKKDEEQEFINIEFTFQVNWKLSQYYTSFDLSRIVEEFYWEVTLKNFEEWYKVVSLFNTMWYYFETQIDKISSNYVIKKWIEKCIEQDPVQYKRMNH